MDMDRGSARLGQTQESRWMAESLGQGGLGVQGGLGMQGGLSVWV